MSFSHRWRRTLAPLFSNLHQKAKTPLPFSLLQRNIFSILLLNRKYLKEFLSEEYSFKSWNSQHLDLNVPFLVSLQFFSVKVEQMGIPGTLDYTQYLFRILNLLQTKLQQFLQKYTHVNTSIDTCPNLYLYENFYVKIKFFTKSLPFFLLNVNFNKFTIKLLLFFLYSSHLQMSLT